VSSTPSLRPRSLRAHDAALQATMELLWEGGLPAATVDAVSARSGVSKATLYKHWPNRTAMAAEAFGLKMAEAVPDPDTGSLRGDLRELLRRVNRTFASHAGTVFAQMLAAGVSHPDSAQYFDRFYLAGRRKAGEALWRRARERGEVKTLLDVETVSQILFGPLIFRLMTGKLPIEDAELEAILEAVLGGFLLRP
jgi:AcrR family transcriptional regulator